MRLLRTHLAAKLAKSAEAAKLQGSLLQSGGDLAREVGKLNALLATTAMVAASQGDETAKKAAEDWTRDLEQFRSQLGSVDGLTGVKARLQSGWHALPGSFAKHLAALTATVEAKPDQTTTVDAHTFLATAQMRLGDYREAMRQSRGAEAASKTAKAAYDAYCQVMETELNALYEAVQEDFSTFPLVESNVAIWDEIAAALAKGKVEVAAAALRHHLEYVSRHLADQIGALGCGGREQALGSLRKTVGPGQSD